MIDSLTRMVGFERHPASIDRYAESGATAAPGFGGITTWTPYCLPDDAPPSARVAPGPMAALDREAPPPDIRSPPLPVRPAVVEARPAPVPVWGAEPAPALPDPVLPPARPPAANPASDANAPQPLFGGYRPAPLVGAPLLGPAPDGVLADFATAALVRRSLDHEEDTQAIWEGMSVTNPVARQGQPRRAIGRGLAAAGALTALLAGLVLAALRYGPTLLGSGQTITAVFNAPMMVVRAAASGRVVSVEATASQIVDPQSPLLTIHTDDGKDDRPVLAGVHGMIRSVETVPGAALVSGAPLVRLQDCDRAFLTVPAGTRLRAGQIVQVTLSDQKPVPGKVRNSAGVMEPPDSLVVGLEPGAVTACPVGHSAAVMPVGS